MMWVIIPILGYTLFTNRLLGPAVHGWDVP